VSSTHGISGASRARAHRHSAAKSPRQCPEARTPLSGPRPRTPARDREKRGSVQGRPGRARLNKALQRTRLDPDGDDVHEYWTRLWKTTSSSSPGSPLSLRRSTVLEVARRTESRPAGRAVLGKLLMALAAGATHLRYAARLRSGSAVRSGETELGSLMCPARSAHAKSHTQRDMLTGTSNAERSRTNRRQTWVRCLGRARAPTAARHF
jgi:hypothetical protein